MSDKPPPEDRVARFIDRFGRQQRRGDAGGSGVNRCSFCTMPEDDARPLIAGPGVFICDECVARCNELLNDESAPKA